MARKRIHSSLSADAGAIPAPLAKPRHRSKAAPKIVEVIEQDTTAAHPAAAVEPAAEDKREEIARLAYSYWEARGHTGGSAEEDWLRAEHEYRSRRERR